MPISYTLSNFRKKQHIIMDSTLLNKHTKFGAKIFKGYWVITF